MYLLLAGGSRCALQWCSPALYRVPPMNRCTISSPVLVIV